LQGKSKKVDFTENEYHEKGRRGEKDSSEKTQKRGRGRVDIVRGMGWTPAGKRNIGNKKEKGEEEGSEEERKSRSKGQKKKKSRYGPFFPKSKGGRMGEKRHKKRVRNPV